MEYLTEARDAANWGRPAPCLLPMSPPLNGYRARYEGGGHAPAQQLPGLSVLPTSLEAQCWKRDRWALGTPTERLTLSQRARETYSSLRRLSGKNLAGDDYLYAGVLMDIPIIAPIGLEDPCDPRKET